MAKTFEDMSKQMLEGRRAMALFEKGLISYQSMMEQLFPLPTPEEVREELLAMEKDLLQ